jgi:lysophospholipase L1-like esterase
MRFALTILGSLLALPACDTLAAPLPIRVILVGDSTMATHSGYGDALCARLAPAVACVNLARGGRSTASFRAEGRWDEVRRMLQDGGSFGATYVLVQFGHNDQPGKPGRSTDLVTEFPVNMARYANEARAAPSRCWSRPSPAAASTGLTCTTTLRRGPPPRATRRGTHTRRCST